MMTAQKIGVTAIAFLVLFLGSVQAASAATVVNSTWGGARTALTNPITFTVTDNTTATSSRFLYASPDGTANNGTVQVTYTDTTTGTTVCSSVASGTFGASGFTSTQDTGTVDISASGCNFIAGHTISATVFDTGSGPLSFATQSSVIWLQIFGTTYTPPVSGCMDPDAENYDPVATTDDGSCTYGPLTELCILTSTSSRCYGSQENFDFSSTLFYGFVVFMVGVFTMIQAGRYIDSNGTM